jgi:hypothetical protein
MSRRLPLIFVAAVTVIGIVVAAVAIAVSGVDGGATAFTVNGTKVSQATLDHQLKELADSKTVRQTVKRQGGDPDRSTLDPTITASLISAEIAHRLVLDEAQHRGVKVSKADLAKERASLKQQLAGLPASYVDLSADLNAHAAALGFDSTALNTFLVRAFRKADVTVDPRYGTWHPARGVCPPAGCSATAGAGG